MHETPTRKKSGPMPAAPSESKRASASLAALSIHGAVAGLAILTLAGFLARHWYRFEQICHFRLQYAIGATVMIAACLATRRRRSACVAGFVMVVNAALVLPVYVPPTRPVPAGATHRALLVNVWVDNHQYDRVLDLIAREKPDFAIVNELNPPWAKALEAIHAQYPHRLLAVSRHADDPSGNGLYSRLPISDERIARLDAVGWPSVIATLRLDDASVSLVGTHPSAPYDRRRARSRNRQLDALARWARSRNDPVLLMGDLNVSSWSPYFHDLLADGHLLDSRVGFGNQASWPTDAPLLRIPLEHVLVSDRIAIHDRRLGPDVGSDHYPVIVDFSVLPKE